MTRGGPEVCFVCGVNNAEGLRLAFELDAEARSIRTRWTPEPRFQSFPGIVHGGVLGVLLDEAVGKICYDLGLPAVTAAMNVRYLLPVKIGEEVEVRGRITEENGRMIKGISEIILGDGRTAARAEVTMIRGKP